MTEEKREFTGAWIPAIVYLNREVSWNAKVIWVEINNFNSIGKECYFSNKHLADFLKCSLPQVTRYIRELKEVGWAEEVSFDGRKRILRSLLPSSKLIRHPRQKGVPRSSKNDLLNIPRVNIPNEDTVTPTEITPKIPFTETLELSAEIPKDKSARERCIEFWLKEFHPGWGFGGAQGKCINSIVNKLKAMVKPEFKGNLDDWIADAFIYMCRNMDSYYQGKDLQVIDSKFNEIIYQIKTGKKNDSFNSKNSADRLSEFYGLV